MRGKDIWGQHSQNSAVPRLNIEKKWRQKASLRTNKVPYNDKRNNLSESYNNSKSVSIKNKAWKDI